MGILTNNKSIQIKKKPEIDYEKVNLEQEKQIFDLLQLLEISKSLNSFLEFDRLIESILYGVMAQLKILGAAIFTKKGFEKNVFVLHRDNYGFDIHQEILAEIPGEHPLLKFVESKAPGATPKEIIEGVKVDRIVQSMLALGPTLFVPLIAKNKLVGLLLLGERMEGNLIYTDYEKSLLADISSLGAIAINNAQLLEMTTTDMMTGLKLKHYFYTVLNERLENLNTDFLNPAPLSILMLDIDFFKKVNDTYGHEAGDIVLIKVASIIKNATRVSDMAARYGGEEFVVMLSGNSVRQAVAVAERIRSQVETMVIIVGDKTIKVTISIGIAGYKFDWESERNLVNRADKALYFSKENGRNRITVSKDNLTDLK